MGLNREDRNLVMDLVRREIQQVKSTISLSVYDSTKTISHLENILKQLQAEGALIDKFHAVKHQRKMDKIHRNRTAIIGEKTP